MKPKNIIHEIFPAEKRLARIDQLDIELERRRPELSVPEYMRAKQALTVRRFKEFRRLERANGWNPWEIEEPPESTSTEPPAIDSTPPPGDPEPETPLPRRLLHYAIFWGWMVVLSLLICGVSSLFKK